MIFDFFTKKAQCPLEVIYNKRKREEKTAFYFLSLRNNTQDTIEGIFINYRYIENGIRKYRIGWDNIAFKTPDGMAHIVHEPDNIHQPDYIQDYIQDNTQLYALIGLANTDEWEGREIELSIQYTFKTKKGYITRLDTKKITL